ncbi:hypothetical protein RKT92_00545, partial [Streptococcus pneumoniae]|nr:hypothetical protein [Streptococcus pneumoniae]
LQKTDFYRPEYQKRKDEICPFSSLADFNPLQLTKSQNNFRLVIQLSFTDLKFYWLYNICSG